MAGSTICAFAVAWRSRASWRHALPLVAAALFVTLPSACVTETKRHTGFDLGSRGVSVELRRAIVGIGYSGVLFNVLDGRGAPLRGFTPSEMDIARMEARLPEKLPQTDSELFAQKTFDLTPFRRQYSGHLAKDRRIIQVNFIHFELIKERKLDWKHKRLPVYDAGKRYFQIWYDVNAAQIVKLLPAS